MKLLQIKKILKKDIELMNNKITPYYYEYKSK